MGRVGLADRGVGDAGGDQVALEREQPLARGAQHDGMRAGRQALREARALAGGVNDLGGERAAWQVVPDDDVMMKKRLRGRAVTDRDGRASSLLGAIASVNAS